MRIRTAFRWILAATLTAAACSSDQDSGRLGPSRVPTFHASGGSSSVSPSDVSFPPRNEPFEFRQQLEAKYRDGMGRPAIGTHVDLEGDIVWIQEYLRYRVNACGHQEALEKVFAQIDTGIVQPICTPPVVDVSLEADPGGPYGPVNVNSPITFNGLGSTSSPYPIAHYRWNCGQPGNTSCTRDTPTPTFVYNSVPGGGTTQVYTVTLVVEDTEGNESAPATTTVTVTQVYGF